MRRNDSTADTQDLLLMLTLLSLAKNNRRVNPGLIYALLKVKNKTIDPGRRIKYNTRTCSSKKPSRGLTLANGARKRGDYKSRHTV